MYLELSKLLHELLLLFAVAQGGQDVEENLQQVQILPRYTRQRENGSDAAYTVGVINQVMN